MLILAPKTIHFMSESPMTILVPVGFAEQSLIAMEQAMSFAGRLKAKVVLLTVMEEPRGVIMEWFDDKVKLAELKTELKDKIEILAEEQAVKSGLEVEGLMATGSIYEEIVRVADLISADLIIMGTDGAPKGFVKKMIGSNAYRVVSTAEMPVITIKGTDHRSGIQNIVLPLDLQKETKQKVGRAIKIARQFNSTIHVISVSPTDDEFIVNRQIRNLNQVEEVIRLQGVNVLSKLLLPEETSNISRMVVGYAKEVDADLIVIMTQQETDFTDYFIGSTAQQIIYHSRIPVMSVRPIPSGDIAIDIPGFGV
jgi:nucleotide-binding universal stress UspA family protein